MKSANVLLVLNHRHGRKRFRRIFISVFNQLDAQNLIHNKFYFMPVHVSNTCAHHQEVMHETATYRCDDARGCVMQF